MTKRLGERALLLLFSLSGACGLIYQVVWSRIFTTLFGSTVYAVGTVLAAFMSGLALGSYVLGRWADRRSSPVALYSFVEISIGVSALISLLMLDNMGSLHAWLHSAFGGGSPLIIAGRFVAAFLAVLLPTTLMGATLPILSKALVDGHRQAGRKLGSLYAANTFGAVCGSIAAGFLLIRWIGIHPTVYATAGLNVTIGLAAWLLRGVPASGKQQAETHGLDDNGSAVSAPSYLLPLFALSGFASFGYEILWSRSLVVIFGNSTYAFSTMLAALLAGISLGGYLVRLFIDRVRAPVRLFGWFQVGIGVSAGAAMPLLLGFLYSGSVQSFFEDTRGYWLATSVARFGAAFAVMLIPAILIGSTFPIIGRIYLKNLRHTGREIGKVYAVNTLGNIAGSILPAFVMVPLLGINRSIVLLALLNCCMGFFVMISAGKRLHFLRFAPLAGFAALTTVLAIVPFQYQFPSDTQSPRDRILYYEEGIMATTKVYAKPSSNEKHMSVDGIYIGGSGGTERKELLLAHLPKLLLEGYESELSVGLGSGILIGESALYDRIVAVDCVEISPTVIRGAAYFAEENHNVLANQKVRVIEDDIISYLKLSEKSFDIVSSDAKSRPRSRGNGLFFSKEYYSLLKDHLAPDGLVVQWVPIHMPNSVYTTVIKTFAEVFPHVSLWFFPEVDSILVGSLNKQEIDTNFIDRILSDKAGPAQSLHEHRLGDAETLLANYVASDQILKESTRGSIPNSLEHPIVEFYSFADYAKSVNEMIVENLDYILKLRDTASDDSIAKQVPVADKDGIERVRRAELLYTRGIREAFALSEDYKNFEALFSRAISEAPWNDYIRHQVLQYYLVRTKRRLQAGDHRNAEIYAQRALDVDATSDEAHYLKGIISAEQGEVTGAIRSVKTAVALSPQNAATRTGYFYLLLQADRLREAVEQLSEIIAFDPENTFALKNLGLYYAEKESDYASAVRFFEHLHRINPGDPEAIGLLSWGYFQAGEPRKAKQIVQDSGRYYRKDSILKRQRKIILEGG